MDQKILPFRPINLEFVRCIFFKNKNISETNNHKINGQVSTSNSNIYKALNVVKKEETLTSTSYERVNQGKVKKTIRAQQVKDAKIDNLKLKYKFGQLDVMAF